MTLPLTLTKYTPVEKSLIRPLRSVMPARPSARTPTLSSCGDGHVCGPMPGPLRSLPLRSMVTPFATTTSASPAHVRSFASVKLRSIFWPHVAVWGTGVGVGLGLGVAVGAGVAGEAVAGGAAVAVGTAADGCATPAGWQATSARTSGTARRIVIRAYIQMERPMGSLKDYVAKRRFSRTPE